VDPEVGGGRQVGRPGRGRAATAEQLRPSPEGIPSTVLGKDLADKLKAAF